MKKYIVILGGCFLFSLSCTNEVFELPLGEPIDACDTLNITYQNNVKLIIGANCATSGCHDANSGSGNFTNYNGLKPKLESGFFRSRVLRDQDMPPSGPLPQKTLDELNCWLEKGFPEN